MFSVLNCTRNPNGWCVGIVGTAPPGTEEVSQPSAARHVTPSTATGHCLSSTGAVKQFRQVFSTWNNGAEHLGQVWGGGGGGSGDVKEDFQDEEHLDVLLPLLFALLHRVDVDGEANGRLHSSSGRGAVLGAPERQVCGAAGLARHLWQPGLEQPRPQRHTGWAQQSKAVTVI